jgi:hypothetical protein
LTLTFFDLLPLLYPECGKRQGQKRSDFPDRAGFSRLFRPKSRFFSPDLVFLAVLLDFVRRLLYNQERNAPEGGI